MYAIECRKLTKTYDAKPPVEAVRGIDLLVEPGECFGLLGPNGAGKTTTMEMLEGLLEPTSGEVLILGLGWQQDSAEIKKKIGVSFQETRFQDKLTVAETLTMFRSFYPSGIDVSEAIATVDLQEKANARVSDLSGGQRQRLAIACALLGDPALLFLDEPSTGLDPSSRRDVWRIIEQFKGRGHTVLLTTHYMDEAQRLCDRVAIVDHGEVIADGTPAKLIASLGGEHLVQLTFQAPLNDVEVFSRLAAVSAVRHEEQELTLTVAQLHIAIPEILDVVKRENLALGSLTTHQATLEDVFVELAGRSLSEES